MLIAHMHKSHGCEERTSKKSCTSPYVDFLFFEHLFCNRVGTRMTEPLVNWLPIYKITVSNSFNIKTLEFKWNSFFCACFDSILAQRCNLNAKVHLWITSTRHRCLIGFPGLMPFHKIIFSIRLVRIYVWISSETVTYKF